MGIGIQGSGRENGREKRTLRRLTRDETKTRAVFVWSGQVLLSAYPPQGWYVVPGCCIGLACLSQCAVLIKF